jgi:hypothetical protein
VAAVECNALDDKPLLADKWTVENAHALPAQMARMRAEAAASFILMVD